MKYLCYNSVNFASTGPNFFVSPSKKSEKFLDLGPAIRMKNNPVEVDLFEET
jgi:hypothetical protein